MGNVSSTVPDLVQRQWSQKVVPQQVLNLGQKDVSPKIQSQSCAHKKWPNGSSHLTLGHRKCLWGIGPQDMLRKSGPTRNTTLNWARRTCPRGNWSRRKMLTWALDGVCQWTECQSLVWFQVRAHVWVGGQVPSCSGGQAREETTHWCFSPFLALSLNLQVAEVHGLP